MKRTNQTRPQAAQSAAHERSSRAPGKQTRTARLAGSAGTGGAVQRKAAPATGAATAPATGAATGAASGPAQEDPGFLAALGFVPDDGADDRGAPVQRKASGAEAAAGADQAAGSSSGHAATRISSPDDAAEREADAAASSVVAGETVQLSQRAEAGTIQRSTIGGVVGGVVGGIGGALVGGLLGGLPGAVAGGLAGAAAGAALGATLGGSNVPVTYQDSDVLSADAARQILQDAFGSYTNIDAGNVQVLPQAEFQAAYDRIYGSTPYAWDTWVVPTHGNLNGFAHDGVNYINANAANVTTVPHEMLHNNAAADWRPFVDSPFDEGATEYLEQHALRHAGINTTLTHYPNQRGVVEAFLASGQAENKLFEAYLQGGAATIVGRWVDDRCQGTWAEVKTAMEQSNWATARAHLQAK